ncbi:hypothetical protein MPSEU_000164500 [Mayamaea pseudoterrestris]|nr:hypothetical protein MPSEU_000164500 [Mayamaea pseudoterrestris]
MSTNDSTNKKDYSSLPLVPEHVLKRKHDLDDLARKRAAQPKLKREKRVIGDKRAIYIRKPESILTQAKNKKHHAARFRRVKSKGMQKRASNKQEFETKQVQVDGEAKTVTFQKNSVGAKLVFCIRIRSPTSMPEEVKKVLSKLRLRAIHQGVFLRYDDGTRKMLHLVEPWVVYGPAPAAVITDLIERRGHGRINKERVPLSDNILIEEALGKYNIVCKEDLIHEIVNVGKHFHQASQFLWPFSLSDSKTRFERGTLKLTDGKDYGDRGEAIVEYISDVFAFVVASSSSQHHQQPFITAPTTKTTTLNMFTGIVEEMGTVIDIKHVSDMPLWDGSVGSGTELVVQAKTVLQDAYLGCSICVSGVCLTVTDFDETSFRVGLAPETLRRTYFDALQPGVKVNLERASEIGGRNSGHFVQGHVDGTGTIIDKWKDEDSLFVKVKVSPDLIKYIVPKGFIAIDGTSLTVVDVNLEEGWFTFMLVAYTQQHIIIPSKNVGERLNLEVDVLGKYSESALSALLPRLEALEAKVESLEKQLATRQD